MREKIVNILLQCGMKEQDIESKDYITGDFLDSLMMAEVVIVIEDDFRLEIDGYDIIPENFKNVDAIVELVRKSLER